MVGPQLRTDFSTRCLIQIRMVLTNSDTFWNNITLKDNIGMSNYNAGSMVQVDN